MSLRNPVPGLCVKASRRKAHRAKCRSARVPAEYDGLAVGRVAFERPNAEDVHRDTVHLAGAMANIIRSTITLLGWAAVFCQTYRQTTSAWHLSRSRSGRTDALHWEWQRKMLRDIIIIVCHMNSRYTMQLNVLFGNVNKYLPFQVCSYRLPQ